MNNREQQLQAACEAALCALNEIRNTTLHTCGYATSYDVAALLSDTLKTPAEDPAGAGETADEEKISAAAPEMLAILDDVDTAFATLAIGADHGITSQARGAINEVWERIRTVLADFSNLESLRPIPRNEEIPRGIVLTPFDEARDELRPIDGLISAPIRLIKDDLETSGYRCQQLREDDGRPADFWSVYVSYPGGEVGCIADCETEEQATDLHNLLSQVSHMRLLAFTNTNTK